MKKRLKEDAIGIVIILIIGTAFTLGYIKVTNELALGRMENYSEIHIMDKRYEQEVVIEIGKSSPVIVTHYYVESNIDGRSFYIEVTGLEYSAFEIGDKIWVDTEKVEYYD